jgi:hypothetical protein
VTSELNVGSTFTFIFRAEKGEPSRLLPLDTRLSCLVVMGSGEAPYLQTLLANLSYLGCRTNVLRLPEDSLQSDGPRALVDVLLVDGDVDLADYDLIKKGNPNTRVSDTQSSYVYCLTIQTFILARSVRMTDIMSKFDLTVSLISSLIVTDAYTHQRDQIISIPIKGKLLRRDLLQATPGRPSLPSQNSSGKVSRAKHYDLGVVRMKCRCEPSNR